MISAGGRKEWVAGGILHARVVGTASAFGNRPDDILQRILDLTGLAVHAVLRVDLEALGAAFFHNFVDPNRAVALRGLIEIGQVHIDWDWTKVWKPYFAKVKDTWLVVMTRLEPNRNPALGYNFVTIEGKKMAIKDAFGL